MNIQLMMARARMNHISQALNNNYYTAIMADSPALYLRLSETSGTIAANIGSVSLACTYAGACILEQPTLCRGLGDYSAQFSTSTAGTPTNVQVGTSKSDIAYPDNFTYEAIIRPSSIPTAAAIMSHGYLGALLRLNASGQLNLLSSYHADRGHGATMLSIGSVYHVGVTVALSGVSTFYVNGVSDGNGTTAADYGSPTQTFRVGADTDSGGVLRDPFGGLIDEVAVYPVALSATRMLAHAHAAGLS